VINADKPLLYLPLGRRPYESVWQLQKRLVAARAAGKVDDLLISVEHDPVLTMGRGTDRANLLAAPETLKQRGVGLFEIERGGDITFHGPGQVVLYPIIDLRRRGRDSHKYLRDLESVVIATLAEWGLEAGVKPGLTGIWVGDYKVGAIGVAVSKWITYHGVAINVNVDLSFFDLINPCGITDYPVGSIAQLLGKGQGMREVERALVRSFAKHFAYNVKQVGDPDKWITDL